MQSKISLTTGAHRVEGARSHGTLLPTILPRARRGVDTGANAPKVLKAADCPSVYWIIVLDDLLAPHGAGLAVLRESRIRNPHARLFVVTTDGAIIRDAEEMRTAVFARLGKRFDQFYSWPPLRLIEYRTGGPDNRGFWARRWRPCRFRPHARFRGAGAALGSQGADLAR